MHITGFGLLVVALAATPLIAGEYQLHALIVSLTFLLPALG